MDKIFYVWYSQQKYHNSGQVYVGLWKNVFILFANPFPNMLKCFEQFENENELSNQLVIR